MAQCLHLYMLNYGHELLRNKNFVFQSMNLMMLPKRPKCDRKFPQFAKLTTGISIVETFDSKMMISVFWSNKTIFVFKS